MILPHENISPFARGRKDLRKYIQSTKKNILNSKNNYISTALNETTYSSYFTFQLETTSNCDVRGKSTRILAFPNKPFKGHNIVKATSLNHCKHTYM